MFKKISIGVAVLSLIALVGCEANFSKGVNKDLLSGLQVTNDGLTYEEAYLTVDDERTTASSFDLGTEVYMNFTGVDYFEEKDGMVFPGAMLVVVDKDGKEIMEQDDLFAQYSESGVTAEMAKAMFVSLIIGNPMESGESYSWYSKVWDKVGEGKIEGTLDFEVK